MTDIDYTVVTLIILMIVYTDALIRLQRQHNAEHVSCCCVQGLCCYMLYKYSNQTHIGNHTADVLSSMVTCLSKFHNFARGSSLCSVIRYLILNNGSYPVISSTTSVLLLKANKDKQTQTGMDFGEWLISNRTTVSQHKWLILSA